MGLSAFETELFTAISARQPGICVHTLEETRMIFSLAKIVKELASAKRAQRTLYRWSAASYVKVVVSDPEHHKVEGDQAAPPPPPEKILKDWVEKKEDSILAMCDIEPFLDRSPVLVRIMRETLERVRGHQQTLVLINKDFRIPDELRQVVMTFRLDPPTLAQLTELVVNLATEMKSRMEQLKDLEIGPETARAFALACSGLTTSEASVLVNLAIVRFRCLDQRAVALAHREKGRILLQGGALAMREPRFGFADIGGLEHAKAWAQQITPIIADPAETKAYGLKIPSGLLLIGCPGTGKSRLAESLAFEWRLPMLLFDVGSCFGSLVGDSERNVRRMMEMANSVKPCVVFVDEIEKGLGGDSHDGGTTSRVKQSLLTWLQDKPEAIFVVATANDLRRLEAMPELVRAGRFDQKFFVDLPDAAARQEIFRIHFTAAGHIMEADTLREAALATRKYSGAEIETVVQQALRIAFGSKPRAARPTKGQILTAAAEIKPLAETMAESISRLRAWCKDGRAKLAGGQMEDEESIRAGDQFNLLGN